MERDIQDWNQRREVAHPSSRHTVVWAHFNDLPSMRGNHDYIFDFLKVMCAMPSAIFMASGKAFRPRH